MTPPRAATARQTSYLHSLARKHGYAGGIKDPEFLKTYGLMETTLFGDKPKMISFSVASNLINKLK